MKKLKSLLCILLVVLMAFTFAVGTFAVDGDEENTDTVTEAPQPSDDDTPTEQDPDDDNANESTTAAQSNSRSNNANLSSVTIVGKTENGESIEVSFSPKFNSSTEVYEATVPYEVVRLEISAVTAHRRARINIPEGYLSLDVGSNKSYVDVTSESGRQKRYTFNIVRSEEETTISEPISQEITVTLAETTTIPITMPVAGEASVEKNELNIYTKLGIVLGCGSIALLISSIYMFIRKKRFNGEDY